MNTDFLFLNTTGPTVSPGFRHKFTIKEFECGLVYRHGKFVKRLAPGRHVRWGYGYSLATVDLRKQTFTVSGQEVLSADNVGLKLSVAVTMQVTDPLKALNEVQDWRAHIYTAVQLALRAIVAAEPIEALLVKRLDLGKQLVAAVKVEAEMVGVIVQATEVKDVMFPGELKKVFAEVIKAKQEGQAALERARGESAALRNLANAARLLESNPALQNLRLLQSITAAGANGSTLVMGLPAGFLSLKAGKAPAGADDVKENGGE
jgi:regulator of protease activity HflC (stomatin/prohibitin superfamily)